MTLQTRKPTGAVPWPLILVEGGEKTGKSYAAALLSKSDKVGRTLWLDWGEGAADEYGAIPGTRYEIIEHDGTWASIYGQVCDAKEEAQRAVAAGEPPVVLIIDSITCEWESLKDWASDRAKTQKSNREKLAKDPNAEPTVTQNLWNDAVGRHRKLMTVLMTFPGIVVLTARGGEVAKVEGGKPVEGEKVHRVEAQKNLGFDVSFWLRLSRDSKPLVVGARSVHHGIRPGIDAPKTIDEPDWTLEWLIFDVLKCDPTTAHVRDLVEPKSDTLTPEQIRDEACHPHTVFERIVELYRAANRAGYGELSLTNETGDEEPLLAMLHRLGDERRGTPAGQNGSGPPTRQPDSRRPPAQQQRAQQPAPRKQVDPQAEEEYVREFYARLAAEDLSLDQVAAMRREVLQSQLDYVITKEVSDTLLSNVDSREAELKKQEPAPV